ncbi:MAG: hypothetical protein GY854_08970 [Deltaproteobacteria bacterium]|nr:hypothetical protein [Deltaproteobacteria bacterium]
MRRVRLWREWGYKGWIVVVTEDPSLELLMRCLQSGVDDILAYGQYLSLDEEIRNLLSGHRASGGVNWNPEAIMKMGLFRTLGLSEYQIRILAEYALDFPRHRILAERIGTNGNQLRKIFSRIYEKLDEKFAVSNQAQLAQFLTICSTLG